MRHEVAALASVHDPMFFAARPHRSGAAEGWLAFMEISPADAEIEVGHIWFPPAMARTWAATEAMLMLFHHAMDDLGYRRLVWKCQVLNAASRRAAERFGFAYEGTHRNHRIIKGRSRDTAWYSIIDSEWPRCRDAMLAWLDDANFDHHGVARRPLASFRDWIRSHTGGISRVREDARLACPERFPPVQKPLWTDRAPGAAPAPLGTSGPPKRHKAGSRRGFRHCRNAAALACVRAAKSPRARFQPLPKPPKQSVGFSLATEQYCLPASPVLAIYLRNAASSQRPVGRCGMIERTRQAARRKDTGPSPQGQPQAPRAFPASARFPSR